MARCTRPIVGRVTLNCSINASYVGSREPGAYRPAKISAFSARAMATAFRDGMDPRQEYPGLLARRKMLAARVMP